MEACSDSCSCFEKVFDVAVYGAGLAGFSAARSLAGNGLQVLLFEPSLDLLWELTRSLESSDAGGDDHWREWGEALRQRNGVARGFVDPALAKIVAAHELHRSGPNLSTLFQAVPLESRIEEDKLIAVTVATKGGWRSIRARQWVDTSERGLLAALCSSTLQPRTSDYSRRSLILHSLCWEKGEAAAQTYARRVEGGAWLETARPEARRFSWTAQDSSWHQEVLNHAAALRNEAGGSAFIISQMSLRDFPVYLKPASKLPSLPDNLLILSPSLLEDLITLPGERFALGSRAPGLLGKRSRAPDVSRPLEAKEPVPVKVENCEVLVAGSGTAGSIAALAAARCGSKTIVLESSLLPGGMGTGGGIASYFHGIGGGLQEEADALSREISLSLRGFAGTGSAWHYASKMLALFLLLEREKVSFTGDALLCGVERNSTGQVSSVLAAVNGRLIRYCAKCFIDSTGDGDLCAQAGAGFESGRPGDQRSLSYSQPAFHLYDKERLSLGVHNYDAGWVDATDPEDLSRARLEGIAQYLRDSWPDTDRPIAIAPLLGLRQSRHIHTDIRVELDDLIYEKCFDDDIGEAAAVLDTHSVDFEFESDDVLFYQWVCRAFRYPLRVGLPYGMLLPKGLENVWIACRASGVSVDAAYCVRMQRDMQRLGEAAGIAASLAVQGNGRSRDVPIEKLQSRLDRSGARSRRKEKPPSASEPDPLTFLDQGTGRIQLWHIYRNPSRYCEEVRKRLQSGPDTSFYAASILAMWGDNAAEKRLLETLQNRELGPSPEERSRGAFGQIIDIPFWVLALVLLRRCGSSACLSTLREMAGTDLPFNLRTSLALTIERLASQNDLKPELAGIFRILEKTCLANLKNDSFLNPSRSLWQTLQEESQKKMNHLAGSDTRQDHSWQLERVFSRIREKLD